MLPQETSVRQLKMLRALTKGKDIGDLTKDDRLNHNVPNLQYIGNPIDTGIESWQEFCQKDNNLQTIAFKSKLVNKPIVKENKTENMKDIKKFENFEDIAAHPTTVSSIHDYFKNIWSKNDSVKDVIIKNDLSQYYKYIDPSFDWDSTTDNELQQLWIDWSNDDEKLAEIGESIKTFEEFEFAQGEEKEDLLRQLNVKNRNNHNPNEYARIKKMDDEEEQEFSERPFEEDDEEDDEDFDKIDFLSDFEKRETDSLFGKKEIEEIDELESDDEIFSDEDSINDEDDLEESIKTFEAFSVPAAKKEAKQPEYTILGEEKEPKSDPNFGYAAVRAQEIKKISDFNLIDPPTPKERTIGGNAGVFIDNDTVKGYLNRIEGKDAYVESLDEPMVIKKFNLKDVVKTKKSE